MKFTLLRTRYIQYIIEVVPNASCVHIAVLPWIAERSGRSAAEAPTRKIPTIRRIGRKGKARRLAFAVSVETGALIYPDFDYRCTASTNDPCRIGLVFKLTFRTDDF